MADAEIELRPATLDDAGPVADLETARTPDEPVAGVMMAYWWTHPTDGQKTIRLVGERDGAVAMFVEAEHDRWHEHERHFGYVRTSVHPAAWTDSLFREGMAKGESWLRSESGDVAVAAAREDFHRELALLSEMGYKEERRERYWELDLEARRAELLAMAEKSRADMKRQGIALLTLNRDSDPKTLVKLYELDLAATRDIPTTVPIHMSGFETWSRNYFENPGIRKDRFNVPVTIESNDILFELRRSLYAHVQALSLSFYERYTSGRIISRLTSDIDALNELLATGRFLTVLPGFMLKVRRRNLALKALPVALPNAPMPIGLVTLKNRTLTPLAQLFIENVRDLTKPMAKS